MDAEDLDGFSTLPRRVEATVPLLAGIKSCLWLKFLNDFFSNWTTHKMLDIVILCKSTHHSQTWVSAQKNQ